MVPSAEFDHNSVVADLGTDLTVEWKHFLALSALQGVPVYHVKQFNVLITGRVTVDDLRENTLGAIVPSLIYPQFKRALDFLGALFLLPFIAPIIGTCAVVIKLETPGPIFYPSAANGSGRQTLHASYKSRTMMHKHDGENYTVENDTRITRVGRFAQVSHRRAAANRQYSARQHELDRPSSRGDTARRVVRARGSFLCLSPYRSAGPQWLGAGASGQCSRGGCRPARSSNIASSISKTFRSGSMS